MNEADMKAHTEAMLALAAAINSLVQALPPRTLGGYASPMFTVECRCTCSQPQYQNYPTRYPGQQGS